MDIDFHPEQVDPSAFIAPDARVLGDVTLGPHASVWFGAVIRGDTSRIAIGAESNVQDLSVLHADPGFPCIIGRGVTLGHGAIVHGATIEDDVMIGIRAVVLNGARVGSGSIIGAGAVVTEGTIIEAGQLAVGIPARVIRPCSAADRERIAHAARHYVAAAADYRQRFR